MSDVGTLAAPPVREEEWESLAVPDGYRAEIIAGELVVTPGPPLDHRRAQGRLHSRLNAAAPPGYEAVFEPEWRLAVAGVVAMAPVPDLVVISTDVAGPRLTDPPLLAVEVRSRSDRERLADGRTRREGKLADYAANGVEDYLEIDLTAQTPTALRYELRGGELVEVQRAEGSEPLAATRPFSYTIVPADLR